MDDEQTGNVPGHCPVCGGELLVTRLQCSSCATEVNGEFRLGQLATLREPHATLLEMFLRKRGNVKEMERELGLSYPTVRARLDEAFEAAGFPKEAPRGSDSDSSSWEARFEAELAERIQTQIESQLESIGKLDLGGIGRMGREGRRAEREADLARERADILDRLERGEVTPDDAAALLRRLKPRR